MVDEKDCLFNFIVIPNYIIIKYEAIDLYIENIICFSFA